MFKNTEIHILSNGARSRAEKVSEKIFNKTTNREYMVCGINEYFRNYSRGPPIIFLFRGERVALVVGPTRVVNLIEKEWVEMETYKFSYE